MDIPRPGFRSTTPYLFVKQPAAYLDHLRDAFGGVFERLGRTIHFLCHANEPDQGDVAVFACEFHDISTSIQP